MRAAFIEAAIVPRSPAGDQRPLMRRAERDKVDRPDPLKVASGVQLADAVARNQAAHAVTNQGDARGVGGGGLGDEVAQELPSEVDAYVVSVVRWKGTQCVGGVSVVCNRLIWMFA